MRKDGGPVAVDYEKIREQLEFQNSLLGGKPFKWMGQTVLFKSNLYGKDYYWMRDGDGTHYLVKCGSDGFPDFSPI